MAKGSIVTIGDMQFETIASVTRPVLKIEGKAVIFRVDGKIVQAPATEAGRAQKDANGVALPPPNLMDVTDLTDGEEKTVVVNTVLGKNLEEKYPDDSYVGRIFQVTKFAAAGAKRYATFQIAELKQKVATGEKAAEGTTKAPAAGKATTK